MKLKLSIIAFMGLIALATNAQNTITGLVIDNDNQPIPYANVVCLSLPDSSFIEGTVTNIEGLFELKSAASDKKTVKVSSVGYVTTFEPSAAQMRITLASASTELDEVSVKAQLPKTKLTTNGLLTAIDGSVLSNIGDAMNMLMRVPGMMRGMDGPEVIGRGTPVYYINGRKVRDTEELYRLHSDEIESVEVINNPGVEYDSSTGAVVLIKLKKRQGDGLGFNLSVKDSQSLQWSDINDYGGSFNINYRKGIIDVFGGVAYQYNESVQKSDLYLRSTGPNSFTQSGTLDYYSKYETEKYKTGLNIAFNDHHSAGIRAEVGVNTKERSDQVLKEKFVRGSVLVDDLVSEAHSDITKKPVSTNINGYYNGRIGNLSVDFNADYYGKTSYSKMVTDEASDITSDNKVTATSEGDSKIVASKLTLAYPLWGGTIQGGNENTFITRKNEYYIDETSVPSSNSKAEEDNVAFYLSYAHQIGEKSQINAGLRYERVKYDYDDKLGTDNIDRTFNNFFPSLSFSTMLGNVQAAISVNSKTVRPSYSMLDGAIRYHTRYTLQGGNTQLQNQKNYEANINLRYKIVTVSLMYVQRRNLLSNWSYMYNEEKGTVLVMSENIKKPINNGGIFISAAPTIGCWTPDITVGGRNQWLTLDVPDPSVPSGHRKVSYNDKVMYMIAVDNIFELKNGWQFEVGEDFRSRMYDGVSDYRNNFFYITAAIQKTLLNNSMTIRLAGVDLANTYEHKSGTDSGTHIIRQDNKFDVQRLTLSVRYNFNPSRSKYKGTGAGKDAAERI